MLRSKPGQAHGLDEVAPTINLQSRRARSVLQPGSYGDVAVRYLNPADRALDVLAPMIIHRPIGRRLSEVYVDNAMRPVRSGSPTQRLSDVVYWRTQAVPGEQIQERSGGMVLVT